MPLGLNATFVKNLNLPVCYHVAGKYFGKGLFFPVLVVVVVVDVDVVVVVVVVVVVLVSLPVFLVWAQGLNIFSFQFLGKKSSPLRWDTLAIAGDLRG